MNRFSNRLVRDLAWVIASPPLVSGNYNTTHWWSHNDCLTEFLACLPTLLTLDKDPSPLIEHFNQVKSGRLGLRFEHFIAYWLKISPNYELLAQNIQIIEPFADSHKKGSHTLGELDFIVRNTRTDETIHLEVAVKFYLGTSPYKNSFRWFGTNTNDQLGKKVAHLKEHQTQLSDKFSAYIQERGYKINVKQCFLKGRLFYPIGCDEAPEGITKNHLRGRWVQSPNRFHGLVYSIGKKDWLSTLSNDDLLNKDMTQGIVMNDNVQCYVRCDNNHTELERIFYLPEEFQFPV